MLKQRKLLTEPAQLLVLQASTVLQGLHEVDGEMLTAFCREPSTVLFVRVTAFRTFPFHEEFRAALARLEAGSYGHCTVCGDTIERNELMASPLGRYCSRCLDRKGAGKAPIGGERHATELIIE